MSNENRICYYPDQDGEVVTQRKAFFHKFTEVDRVEVINEVPHVLRQPCAIIEDTKTGAVLTVVPEVIKFKRPNQN